MQREHLRRRPGHIKLERHNRPGDSWKRYVGKDRRGQPSIADVDGADLRLAVRDFAAGAQAYLAALEIPKSEGRERREAIKTALGRLALATRLVDDLIERRGGIAGDVLGLDEE